MSQRHHTRSNSELRTNSSTNSSSLMYGDSIAMFSSSATFTAVVVGCVPPASACMHVLASNANYCVHACCAPACLGSRT
jgi:hypothetical protein